MNIHDPPGCKRAGDEQQRVPRQKRRDDQPSLAKYDEEKKHVDARAILPGDLEQMLVEMNQQIEKLPEQIHVKLPAVDEHQTTASCLGFSGFTRSSRETPSHITIGLATSTDE